MDIFLDDAEARILGCLIEKEMTTPEYYPLTLNALTNACNQKSNRNPVVSFDENTIEQGLSSLQKKGLVRPAMTAGSRVIKYIHTFLDSHDLSGQEMAVLCEFLVRGPQTAGEIRAHAERMTEFHDLEEVNKVLRGMMDLPQPLIAKLPREAGRKENRYMHLLSGDPAANDCGTGMSEEQGTLPLSADEKIARLEGDLKQVREQLDELKKAFTEFRSQF